MTKKAIELLHYITEAIDNNLGDTEINNRIEEVANNDEISNEECSNIYNLAMLCYKLAN